MDTVYPAHNSSPAHGRIRRGREKDPVDNAGHFHARAVVERLASGSGGIRLWFLPAYSPNLNLIERVWKFFRKKVINNRYFATFREFTEESPMFFECLPDYADELRTLLAHNFQLFGKDAGKTVTNAY